jgi:hypothetical protein
MIVPRSGGSIGRLLGASLNSLLEAAHLPALSQNSLGDPRFALGSVAGGAAL